jgi:hypothetical protein
MTFGYLIVVAKNNEVDYTKLAYSLALSIKNTQKPGFNNVALVTDDVAALSELKSAWVFDQVIEWNKEHGWDGRSWMDQLSPWDNTICLDADMLFTRDVSHWAEYFIDNAELYVANNAYTYRNELVKDDFYRVAFTKNNLPNLYSFYTFFKKDSSIAQEFFTLGRYIIKNPTEFKNVFCPDFKPKVVGTDESFALAAKILDITHIIAYPLTFPKVVHMKPMIQNWPWPADTWTNHVGFYFNVDNELKIGNFKQTSIVHYVEKQLITDEIINLQEEKLWQK